MPIDVETDTLLFLCGLPLLYTALVCFETVSPQVVRGPSWTWFGLFSLLACLADWTGMATYAFPSLVGIAWCQSLIQTAAYLAFGISAIGNTSSRRKTKAAVWGVLACCASYACGMWSIPASMGFAAGGLVGLPASLYVAGTSWRRQDNDPGVSTTRSRLFTIGMILYVLAATIQPVISFVKNLGVVIPLLNAWLDTWSSFGGSVAILLCLPKVLSSRPTRDSVLVSRQSLRRRIIVLELGVLALVAFLGMKWRETVMDDDLRQFVVREAEKVARACNPDEVRKLSFTQADRNSATFQRMRAQMRDYAANAGLRCLYSVAVRHDKLLFGPESLDEQDTLASPPGTIYQKPEPALFEVFRARRPCVVGPYTDEYGTFVSGFAPVTDPRTGEVLIAVGVDMLRDSWAGAICRARFWAILLLLLPAAVLFAGQTLLVRRRYQERPGARWYLRHGESILAAVLGTVLTGVSTLAFHDMEERTQHAIFLRLSDAKARLVGSTFDSLFRELSGLTRFVSNVSPLTYEAFSSYTRNMARAAGTQAWEWVPHIPAAEKDRIETSVREQGVADFHIFEKDPEGRKRPVPDRSDYFPVAYITPIESNRAALGFDLGSEPSRRQAIDESIRTGACTATSPITLVQETERQLGILLFSPVYGNEAEEFRGFAVGVIRLQSAFARALVSGTEAEESLTLDLLLLADDRSSRLLATYPIRDDVQQDRIHISIPDSRASTYPLFVFGMSWIVRVYPDQAHSWLVAGPLTLTVATMGILITAVLAFFVAFLVRHQAQLEFAVQRRTAELRQSEKRFMQVAEQSGEIIWEVTPEGRYTYVSHACLPLLGYTMSELTETFSLLDLRPPSARRALKERIEAMETVSDLASQIRSKAGRLLDVVTNIAPVVDDQGRFVGFRGSDRDITQRLAAERNLRENEERLDLVIKSADVGLWDWNVETDRMVCNERWAEMLGCSLDALAPITMPAVKNMIHPDDRQTAEAELQNHLLGTTPMFDCEFRMRHACGDWVWIHSQGRVMGWTPAGKPRRMTGVHGDISARKSQEQAVAATTARILWENGVLAQVATSPNVENGNLREVATSLTESVAEAFGIARVSVWRFDQPGTALVCIDLYESIPRRHSSGAALLEEQYKAEFAALRVANYVDANEPLTDPRTAGYVEGYIKPTGISSMLDAVIRTGEQTWGVLCLEHVEKPHRWSPDEIAFACQLGDQIGITILNYERRLIQEALRAKSEELDRFFTVNLDLLCIADMDARFRTLNPEWTHCLGYTLDELLGQSFMELVHPDDLQDTLEAVSRLQGQEPVINFTNRYRHKNGSYRWLEWRSFPVANLIYAAARDITDRKEAQEVALRRSEDRFRTLLSLSNDGVFILNQEGLIQDANDRACEMLGYGRNELNCTQIAELYSRWTAPEATYAFEVLIRHGEVHFETEFTCKGAGKLPVEISASRMPHDPQLFQLVARDISDRKHFHQHLLASAETERKKLGQELHDGLCQQLKSLEMEAAMLEEDLQQQGLASANKVADMERHINQVVKDAYGLASGMLPASLDTRFFGDALRKLATSICASTAVEIEVRVPPDIRLSNDMAANHLYRIVQEAAGNAIRHGAATRLLFECRREASEFVLMVVDNGQGLDSKVKPVGGLGLSVMRSRAEALGGSLHIEAGASGGVTVQCTCPLSIVQGD